MLSFLEFVDHYDLDLFIKENEIFVSNKHLIISYHFLYFIFKGSDSLQNNNLCRTTLYKKKFIDFLKKNNTKYKELSFNEIYKIKINFDINKILKDCENKKNNVINKMKWVCVYKEDLKKLFNYGCGKNKYKGIKELRKIDIEEVLFYYSEYINKNNRNNKLLSIGVI